MVDEFKKESAMEWAAVDEEASDDGLDLEALDMIEKMLEARKKGFTTMRSITADAYFRPGNVLGFEQCEGFLQSTDRDGLNVIAADTSQLDMLHKLLEISRKAPYVLTATAFSPRSIINKKLPNIGQLEALLASSKKFVAIGDVSLDFHYSSGTKKEQIELFKQQARLAAKFDKPIYINSVKADKELYQVMNELREEGLRLDVICVPVVRTLEMFQMVLDHSCYLLVRPEITHDDEDLYRECIKEVPRERLLLASGEETSAPQSKLGQWNSPEFVDETSRYAADLLDMELPDFMYEMTSNFNKIFNSDPEAGDDEFYFQPTDEEPSLVMTEAKLLENDIDKDGDELFISELLDERLVGDVYFDKKSRLIIYTPKEGFMGADKFKYVVSDGRGGKDSAVVTIYVSAAKGAQNAEPEQEG